MRYWRSLIGVFLLAVIGLFLGLTHIWGPGDPTCKRCNVIIISVDSLRSDHMSLYGYERETTPKIGAWAKDAFVFENYQASAYLTPISAAGLHTGLFAGRHGVINFQASLRPEVSTLAERLQREGYVTAAIGNSPEFEVFPALKKNFSRGFSTYSIDVSRQFVPWDWIKRWVHGAEEPFFIWIPIGKVHWPYGLSSSKPFTDPAYNGVLRNKIVDTSVANYTLDGKLYVPPEEKRTAFFGGSDSSLPHPTYREYPQASLGTSVDISAADITYVNGLYDNGIAQTDSEIGAFLKWLEQNGYSENTVVVIESEHGEDLGEHGYIAHYDVFDTTSHVPLIAKIPGTKGAKISQLVSNVDFAPTLTEILDIPPVQTDGISLMQILRGSAEEVHDAVFISRTPLWERLVEAQDEQSVFSEFRREDDTAHFHDSAIRTHEWKLIHRTAREAEEKYSLWSFIGAKPPARSEFELYDLVHDPMEQKNVADEHPEITAELMKKLLSWEEVYWGNQLFPKTANDLQEYF